MYDVRRVTIGDLARDGVLEFSDGYRTRRDEYGMPGMPILRVADVAEGVVSAKAVDLISDTYRSRIGGKVSQVGDVVLTTKGTVGRVVMIQPDSIGFVYSPQLCYFRLHREAPLSAEYLYYWLQGDAFREQTLYRKSQTDMADYINLADIRSLIVDIPGGSRQEAIATLLGALDAKIANNDHVAQAAHQLLESTWSLAASSSSELRPISEFGQIVKGLSYKGDYLGSGRYLVNLANFTTDGRFKRVRLKKYSGESRERHLVHAGDLLIANTDLTQRREILGQPVILGDLSGEALFSHHIYAFRPLGDQGEEVMWIYGGLRQAEFRARAETFASGTTVASLPQDAVLKHLLPWPSSEKRQGWSRLAGKLLASAWATAEESLGLVELRDALLPELVSGRLGLKDAEKIVEDST